ncbi:MAG TPA: hypothetical protein DCG53_11645 [Syntrophus sp. (in: bacteria)]|jgi:hypothetical protein|nr:hypothetical protein [Syntrophus sp. (in: bacteria)]
MKEARFSVAGVNFDLIAHGAAAKYLLDELPGLLPGFLINKKNLPNAVCLVHFDHELTYPLRFHSEPHLIRCEDSSINEAIIARMGKIPFSFLNNSSEAIGFLNGCLIFDDCTNRGLIYVFCSDEANHFVATLLKLLFVFTCLVMANKSRLMVHGAGIKKRKGRGGYLFLGTSGAGKSTVAALSSGDMILSDDATVIEVAGGACLIHATPFRQVGIVQPSSKRLYLEQEKLDKLLFLHQSATTFIKPREQRSAFTELLKEHLHCFEVMGEPLRRNAFYLCRDVCEMTPAYDLFSRKDPGFWELVLVK